MCGIVGMSFRTSEYRNPEKHVKAFTEMLTAAQARGSSATGIFMAKKSVGSSKPKAYVLKAPIAAKEFVQSKEYKDLMSKLDKDTYYIVGHTRAVTGNASASLNHNNHPHISGDFIGVHNGCVSNYGQLRKSYNGPAKLKSTCDSEIIFALADKYKIHKNLDSEDAVEAALKDLTQAWFAIVTADLKRPTRLILAKDESTPLHLFWSAQYGAAYFASNRHYVLDSAKTSDFLGSLAEKNFPANSMVTFDSTTEAPNNVMLVAHRILTNKNEVDKTSKAYRISQGL